MFGSHVTKSTIAFLPILAALVLPANSASFQYKTAGSRATELSGLYGGEYCSPPAAYIQRKIVQRDFAEDGVSLNRFVLERKNGSRAIVNIWIHNDLSEVEMSWEKNGLQTLIRKGRTIHGTVMLCGAAGRALWLDSVR